MRFVPLIIAAMLASPAAAQVAPALVPKPRTILFVGNSFTHAALSPIRRYRAGTVTDLNKTGSGGVPAVFKAFADEMRLNYTVSLETQGGMSLGFHWAQRRALVDRAWDVVVLQELSTLDSIKPGATTEYRFFAPQFATMFAKRNPRVDVELMATWSRADLTYRPGSPWSGKPITAMALDVRRAADDVNALSPAIKGVIPVGEAWNRAFAGGIADHNPYDGISYGKVDLWAWDHYHASVHGYYLEALVVFGKVTGVDPTLLGAQERVADDLGIAPDVAVALQRVAKAELATHP